jgi:hypothetical protein
MNNDIFDTKELNSDQAQRVIVIRDLFNTLMNDLAPYVLNSRETSLGKTKLEEAAFWFIKGISREVQLSDVISTGDTDGN